MSRKLVIGSIGIVSFLLLALVACSSEKESASVAEDADTVNDSGSAMVVELNRPPIQIDDTVEGRNANVIPEAVMASQAIVVRVVGAERNTTTGQTKMVFELFADAGKEILAKRRSEYLVSNWHQSPREALLGGSEGYVVDTSGLGFFPPEGGTHKGERVVIGSSPFSDAEKKEGRESYALEQILAMILDVGIVYSTTGKDARLDMGDAVVGDSFYLFPMAIVKMGESFPGFPLGTRLEILNSKIWEREGWPDLDRIEIAVYPPTSTSYRTTVYEGAWFGQQRPVDIILPMILPADIEVQLLNLETGDMLYIFVDR